MRTNIPHTYTFHFVSTGKTHSHTAEFILIICFQLSRRVESCAARKRFASAKTHTHDYQREQSKVETVNGNAALQKHANTTHKHTYHTTPSPFHNRARAFIVRRSRAFIASTGVAKNQASIRYGWECVTPHAWCAKSPPQPSPSAFPKMRAQKKCTRKTRPAPNRCRIFRSACSMCDMCELLSLTQHERTLHSYSLALLVCWYVLVWDTRARLYKSGSK